MENLFQYTHSMLAEL